MQHKCRYVCVYVRYVCINRWRYVASHLCKAPSVQSSGPSLFFRKTTWKILFLAAVPRRRLQKYKKKHFKKESTATRSSILGSTYTQSDLPCRGVHTCAYSCKYILCAHTNNYMYCIHTQDLCCHAYTAEERAHDAFWRPSVPVAGIDC